MTGFNEGEETRVLSVYRSLLLDNRGTPLRVKSLILEGRKDENLDWYTCTLDESSPLGLPHLSISNDHLEDIKKIRSFVKENNIDVIIFHTIAAGFYLLPLKLLTRSKMVLEMHGFREEESLLYEGRRGVKYFFEKVLFSVIYFFCDLITTCSDSATGYLLKFNKNVVSVYGGVDLKLFNPGVRSGGYIKKSDEKIIVGYAGNARKWQGLPFLLEAFDDLVQKYPQFRLELLTSEDKEMSTREYVHITKSVPHEAVAGFTVDCDILVLPRIRSRVNELTYPGKFMEYMAMGKAVVVSRTSDMYRIINDGENGLLFEPEDKEGFIAAMSKLTDKNFREKLGTNAHKTAVETYTWDVQGAIFLGGIKRLFA